jgi:hypothetical protein
MIGRSEPWDLPEIEEVGSNQRAEAPGDPAGHVTPKTRERSRQTANKQIIPNIGQVQKLRPVHLADLYAKLLKAGLSPRTVGMCIGFCTGRSVMPALGESRSRMSRRW